MGSPCQLPKWKLARLADGVKSVFPGPAGLIGSCAEAKDLASRTTATVQGSRLILYSPLICTSARGTTPAACAALATLMGMSLAKASS